MLTFSEILGQERAKKILQRSIETNRVSHAYLLLGPEGTGKRSLALAFAAALNCQGDPKPCKECHNCRRIAEGNHPDLTILEPEGRSFKINQIRRLQQLISFKPYEGNYKIFILDGVETFTDQAANSLLKTLEEPPSHSVLILLANDSLLLPTITSRCNIVQVQPLPDAVICHALQEKGLENSSEITPLAAGSLGRALELAENWTEVTLPVRDFLTKVEADSPWELDKTLISRFKENQDFQKMFLDICQEEYKSKKISQSSQVVKAVQEIEESRQMLKSNVGPEAVLRSLAIKLARIQRSAL